MIYLDYEIYKERLIIAQKLFNEVLAEAEELFAMTQEKSTKYGRERVQTSAKRDVFDAYLCAKEAKQIDKRLKETKSLLDDRKFLLMQKENDLRASKDIDDLIYTYKFLDGKKADWIARKMNYSESQIFRRTARIKAAIQSELEGDIIKT